MRRKQKLAKAPRETTALTLTERHVIRRSSTHFKTLKEFCHLSKNLYNHANFLIRKAFVSNRKWLRYQEIEKLTRNDNEFPDYSVMPIAKCAQQTLRVVDSPTILCSLSFHLDRRILLGRK